MCGELHAEVLAAGGVLSSLLKVYLPLAATGTLAISSADPCNLWPYLQTALLLACFIYSGRSPVAVTQEKADGRIRAS